ncbi:TRAP transporter large permease subunit [Chloroflexota bacterium]
MSGITGVGAVTMGLIALPAMLKRNYDKGIAVGCIPAGGALGALIPPSMAMILYGIQAEVSIGKLFIGGILPGLLLSSLFIIYIGIRCFLQPKLGPALPPEERASWLEKLLSLRAIIIPLLIVVGVLGSIFAGVATVTEAAAVGAICSVLSAAIYGRLKWKMIKESSYATVRLSSMVLLIIVGSTFFTTVFSGLGGSAIIGNIIEGLPLGRWGILMLMQISFLLLGCLLDPTAIIVITTPIYVPIITSMGFDPLWFGILFVLNMEMGFLTPPFGLTLFMFKGVVPEGITMGDIYRSIFPFIMLQALALAIVMIFPAIALWLPSMMLR